LTANDPLYTDKSYHAHTPRPVNINPTHSHDVLQGGP